MLDPLIFHHSQLSNKKKSHGTRCWQQVFRIVFFVSLYVA